MEEKVFLDKLNNYKDDSDELYSILIGFAKNNLNLYKYENIYEGFLADNSWELRKAAIFGLLFKLGIKNVKYKNAAISFFIDTNEEFDLRVWALSSSSTAYEGTQDSQLLKEMYFLLNSKDENLLLIESAFFALLGVWGVSAVEVEKKIKRNLDGEFLLNDSIQMFKVEYSKIEKKVLIN